MTGLSQPGLSLGRCGIGYLRRWTRRMPGAGQGREASAHPEAVPKPAYASGHPPSLSGSLSWSVILQCLEQKESRGNHGVSQSELCRLQNRNCLHLT